MWFKKQCNWESNQNRNRKYGRKNILNAAKNCHDYKNDLIKDIDDGGGGDTTKKEWQA